MNIHQKKPTGNYFPETTEEVFRNWKDPLCKSTMERVFGSVVACKEVIERNLLKMPHLVTATEISNIPEFKKFCVEELQYPNTPSRDHLAFRIADEIDALYWYEFRSEPQLEYC